MAQQTAIDWFINQINQYTELEINHADGSKTKTRVIPPWIMQNLIEQAKQMERQQIIDAFNYSIQMKYGSESQINTGNQYYNETYNKE